ncbi:MAG: beta-lactamase family protein [Alicyclobacillus sp.]|nr:beta-lactamase family protein [Alicyclobacillus sp.]
MHSLLWLHRGKVVAETFWHPYHPECPHTLNSLSKSFTSAAVGLAISEGRLTLHQPVQSFFPECSAPSTGPEIQVRHLLTMTTGHASDTLPALWNDPDGDWVQAFLDAPVVFAPGTRFVYNSGATYMLSAILQRVTGERLLDYLRPRLFDPLGIPNPVWETCPRGVNTGGWGLRLRTEDVAQFAQLCLQRGSWRERQLLPADWLDEATAWQTPSEGGGVDWRQGYGYQFWRCRYGAYRGDGAFGQFFVVMPEHESVVVVTGCTVQMQQVLDGIWTHLLPLLERHPTVGPPVDRPDPVSALPTVSSGTAPAEPSRWDGVYRVDPNELGITHVRVAFRRDEAMMELRTATGEHAVACGIGSWKVQQTTLAADRTRVGPLEATLAEPLRIAACGAWRDPTTFEMKWQYVETPHSDTVTCRFTGDEVAVTALRRLVPGSRPVLCDLTGRRQVTQTVDPPS